MAKRSKQDKYTRSARGKPCQVQVPGICRVAPENNTTVLAHLNGGGMAFKHLNIHAAYACAECHEWLDTGYVREKYSTSSCSARERRDLYHLEAVIKTQIIMIEEGILKI